MMTMTVIRKPEQPITQFNRIVKLHPYYGLYTRDKKKGLNFDIWKLQTQCDSSSLQSACHDLKFMFDCPQELYIIGSETLSGMENEFRC